ncbi:MAG: hypothetical protein ACXWWO_01405 [Candidatus Limnocylindria bacterium]
MGFAPTLDDGYALVIEGPAASGRSVAESDVLLALAVAYFEDALDAPPDELAATHADIASLVRHVAEAEGDAGRRRLLEEAVDAIDDGLAADVVIGRLTMGLSTAAAGDPVAWLLERAGGVAASHD